MHKKEDEIYKWKRNGKRYYRITIGEKKYMLRLISHQVKNKARGLAGM